MRVLASRRTLAVVAAVVFASAGAIPAGARLPNWSDRVPVVHAAACKGPNGQCLSGFRTAALAVSHMAWNGEAYVVAVEPSTGESWSITARWNTDQPLPCYEHWETATVDVDWTGAGWVLTNAALTTNVLDIDLCDSDGTCGSHIDPHGYAYVLIVKVNDPITIVATSYNLRTVDFATTSVDDGYELVGEPCAHRYRVSPTTQSFTQSDIGGFECGYSCDHSGASITLTYE